MKRDDLARVTRAIEPGKELKMKVLKAAMKPRGFRLERPGRIVSALGAAALLLACVVGGSFLLKDWLTPGPANGQGAAAQPGATATTSSTDDSRPNTTEPATTAAQSPTVENTPAPVSGPVSLADAVPLARAAYLNYFGIDTGNCDVIDETTQGTSRLLGSDGPVDPKAYEHKAFLEVSILGDCWYFQYCANGSSSEDVQISLDRATGDVVFGSLKGMGPEKVGYSKKELEARMNVAKAYIIEKHMADGVDAVKFENLKNDSDVAVTLLDGRVITLTMDRDRNVVAFSVTGERKSLRGMPIPGEAITAGQAVSTAREAFQKYLGITIGDCPAIDFSGDQPELLGSGETVDPDKYAGQARIEVKYTDYTKSTTVGVGFAGQKYGWEIDYYTEENKCSVITLDAATGDVLSGSVGNIGHFGSESSDAEIQEQQNIAKAFVQNLPATKGAEIKEVEIDGYGSCQVLLKDGRYLYLTLNKENKVLAFSLNKPYGPAAKQ